MIESILERDLLQCTACAGDLRRSADALTCTACGASFPFRRGVPCFSIEDIERRGQNTTAEKAILKRIRERFPMAARLRRALSPPSLSSLRRGPDRIADYLAQVQRQADAVVLDVGSAGRRKPGVVGLDIYDFDGVDICARADRLPFKDGTVDLLLSTTAIEHMQGTDRAIAEMQRVVRPGGLLFVTAPFVHAYHPEPFDLLRWSHDGLAQAFSACDKVEVGGVSGPHQALRNTLIAYGSWLFSFGSYPAYTALNTAFAWIALPLKLAESLHPRYHPPTPLDCVVYYVGRKRAADAAGAGRGVGKGVRHIA